MGTYLSSASASFDPRNYGFPKLVALAEAQPYLEVENVGGGTTRVRLVPGRGRGGGRRTPAKKAAAKKASAKDGATKAGATKAGATKAGATQAAARGQASG